MYPDVDVDNETASVDVDSAKHGTELPTFYELFTALWPQSNWRQSLTALWAIVATCAWKTKLALLLACGVWTDELVETLKVDATAQQHFQWVEDPSRLHEDVMAVVGPMR